MYDERIEIQKIFDRMKPFKVRKVNETSLIHLLKHLKCVQQMVFNKQHLFKMDEETSFEINIEQDLIESKLNLDAIFSEILQDDSKQEIATIHKQLSTVIDNIKKKMIQQKQEEEAEKAKKEAEEKKKAEEEERAKKKEAGIESDDEEEKKASDDDEDPNNSIQKAKDDLFKRKYDQKDLTIDNEEDNKLELMSMLDSSAQQMKQIAGGILGMLENEEKITGSISSKQGAQIKQVRDNTKKINEFLASKDLGFMRLLFMTLISIGLTFITLTFIHFV